MDSWGSGAAGGVNILRDQLLVSATETCVGSEDYLFAHRMAIALLNYSRLHTRQEADYMVQSIRLYFRVRAEPVRFSCRCIFCFFFAIFYGRLKYVGYSEVLLLLGSIN